MSRIASRMNTSELAPYAHGLPLLFSLMKRQMSRTLSAWHLISAGPSLQAVARGRPRPQCLLAVTPPSQLPPAPSGLEAGASTRWQRPPT